MKVLELHPIAVGGGAWKAQLVCRNGWTKELYLKSDKEFAPPEALDGLAMAALPSAMGGGFDVLRVRGPITHGALWRLLEYARIWHIWSPEYLHPTRIEAERVIGGRDANAGGAALVAWSGSVHSSHTLIRMIEHRAAGAPTVGGVMRMTGLRRGDHVGVESARKTIEAMGLRFCHVRTNALRAGLINPRMGRLAWVAAAMHMLSGAYGCGIHARGYPLAAQMIFPRPGPALPDLFSGDGFAIRADGGVIPLPAAVAALSKYPALVEASRETISSRPLAEQMLNRLAFRAAGMGGGVDDCRVALDALLLPVSSGTTCCEARGIRDHWTGSSHGIRKVLAARIRTEQIMESIRDYGRWLLAMAHLRGVYPR